MKVQKIKYKQNFIISVSDKAPLATTVEMECGDTADWKFLHKVGEVDIEAGNFSDLSKTLKSKLKDVSGENN